MEPVRSEEPEPKASQSISSPELPFTELLLDWTSREKRFLAATAALSYLLWTAALVVTLYWGWSHNSYGMPVPGLISLLPISLIAGWVGPWYRNKADASTGPAVRIHFWIWRVWSVLLFLIYIQYLQRGMDILANPSPFRENFIVLAFVAVAVAGVTQWTFILFSGDRFEKVTWPFLGLLPMAVGYFGCLLMQSPAQWHAPLSSIWMILIAMILLYTAVIVAGVESFYGDRTSFGFIYWIFLFSVSLMIVAAITMTKTVEGTGGMLPPVVSSPSAAP